MASPTYFFVNHTRKEFCIFKNDVPVFGAIGSFLNDKIGWNYAQEVVVTTDKKVCAKVIATAFLNADYKDISANLPSLKKKWTFMDRLMCRSVSVVYPLWETISNMPTGPVKEFTAEIAMKNLETMKTMETLVATSV